MKDRILRVRPRFEVKIRTYCHPEGSDNGDFLKICEVLYDGYRNTCTHRSYYQQGQSDTSSSLDM